MYAWQVETFESCMGSMEECTVWWCPGGYHLNHEPGRTTRRCNHPHDHKTMLRLRRNRRELEKQAKEQP